MGCCVTENILSFLICKCEGSNAVSVVKGCCKSSSLAVYLCGNNFLGNKTCSLEGVVSSQALEFDFVFVNKNLHNFISFRLLFIK